MLGVDPPTSIFQIPVSNVANCWWNLWSPSQLKLHSTIRCIIQPFQKIIIHLNVYCSLCARLKNTSLFCISYSAGFCKIGPEYRCTLFAGSIKIAPYSYPMLLAFECNTHTTLFASSASKVRINNRKTPFFIQFRQCVWVRGTASAKKLFDGP